MTFWSVVLAVIVGKFIYEVVFPLVVVGVTVLLND